MIAQVSPKVGAAATAPLKSRPEIATFGLRANPMPVCEPALFALWVDEAPGHEWAMYWEGDLSYTCYGGPDVHEARTRTARMLRKMVWNAYLDGKVRLYQQRLPGKRGFRYMAHKVPAWRPQEPAWDAFMAGQGGGNYARIN